MGNLEKIERIVAFIDGFNLYHAINDLGRPHLKWIDLLTLSTRFAAQTYQQVRSVFYFSAFATWLTGPFARHRAFVEALNAKGVVTVMGRFKEKDRYCHQCGSRWKAHEEKETDVNLALYLLNEARKDTYDHAFVVSNDSDLVPAVRMVKAEFPGKRIRILTPPGKKTSMDLVDAAGGRMFVRTIKESHLAKALLPSRLLAPDGSTITRPKEYDPPAGDSEREES
jgi:uncharacterized LabA/DUF88 family protein